MGTRLYHRVCSELRRAWLRMYKYVSLRAVSAGAMAVATTMAVVAAAAAAAAVVTAAAAAAATHVVAHVVAMVGCRWRWYRG